MYDEDVSSLQQSFQFKNYKYFYVVLQSKIPKYNIRNILPSFLHQILHT